MERKDVKALLAKLHDDPVDNDGATEQILARVYSFLMGVPKDKTGKLHWFCHRADDTTVAAASFLLRLFAYDGGEAEAWRGKLHSSLSGCCECVVEFEEVKKNSSTTYFSRYSPTILDNFWSSFGVWEVEQILRELKRLGIVPAKTDPMVQTLSDVPSPLVLRIVSSWPVFSDERIQTIIHSIPPQTVFQDWPTAAVPPGILVLLIEQTSVVRHWASSQAAKCMATPLPLDNFTSAYIKALETLVYGVKSKDTSTIVSSSDHFSFFSFAADPYDIWTGFSTALRFVPVEFLAPNKQFSIDIRKVVTGHLSDKDMHFSIVLRCFILLLKRLGQRTWADEASEYPLVVFDAVKDNPIFISLLESAEPSNEKPWFLSWIFEYFHTVQKTEKIYGTVVAKISDFLLEELQHERFGDARPIFMESASHLLFSSFSRSRDQDDPLAMKAVLSAVDIHASILSRVAFHRDYDKNLWSGVRSALRQLLDKILFTDVQDVLAVITETCRVAGQATVKKQLGSIRPLCVRKGLWTRVYKSIHRQDPKGLANMLCLVSEASHIETLTKNTFEAMLSAVDVGDGYANGAAAIDTINAALLTIRTGFLEGVKNFVDYSTSVQILDVLKRPRVSKAVMLLLLSPVDDFHTAAKILIGQAFDVDDRLECIRALLEKLPDPSLDGLCGFLGVFCNYAPHVPEACNLSKSLVRCFTDVIDVLCSKPDGLLCNTQYLRLEESSGPASRMIELWTLMSKAIAVIFKRTPAWSIYFNNTEMIEWMRDALIFGRDMLGQWQVIEAAANAFYLKNQMKGKANVSQRSLSSIKQKMINCLQDVLTELSRWLRLTDEELLHQSFSLLQSLLELFRKTDTRPCDAAFTKLTRYADSARKDVHQTRSRLDTSRLTALEEALAAFNEDDDEIQIISHKVGSKTFPHIREERGTANRSTAEPKPLLPVPRSDLRKAVLDQTMSTASSDSGKEKQQDSASAPALPSAKKHDRPMAVTTNQQASRPGPGAGYKNEATTSASVESSSESGESDSDEEAPPGGLASLGKKFAKSPKIKKPAERRQIKTLNIPTSQNAALARINRREEIRRTRLRMKPDISNLHRTLLSWNYDHDGPVPPGFEPDLALVPDVFMDYPHFHRIFEPLLLLECWAQIVQAKDEKSEAYSCKITSKQYIDDWLELDVSFEGGLGKDYYLAETDIVLLRHPQTNKCILAKTRSYNANFQLIQACLRCHLKKGAEDPGLQISTTWRISKVFSLSTLHREYAALKSLPYYDFVDVILQPRLQCTPPPDPQELRRIMAQFEINGPQAAAVLKAMKTDGLSLIQGPPGTGKTSTICGLVSLFLSRRPRPGVPIQIGNNPTSSDRPPLPKILLCAPSNAAIDEIARRIKDGYRGPEKHGDTVKVVRIGTEQSMNVSVKDISLDYLVDQTIDPPKDISNSSELKTLRKELEEVKAKKERRMKEEQENIDSARSVALQAEITELNTRRLNLTRRIDQLKDEQKSASRTLDALRRATRQKVLQGADVICSTLSGSGHEVIEQLDFDMIIIDEAAQAIELSTLIPLKYKCQRCVLVGDPQQLPPTVLSQEACRFRYNQSLFVRMQKSQPDAVHLLSIQYRMHPDISKLPSQVFYQGKLKDGPNMGEKTTQPWHDNPRFGTYKFFNVSKGLEESSGRSIKNMAECHMAAALFNRLKVEYGSSNLDYRVGVVSMYRAQIVELKRQFEQRFGRDIIGRIDFNTVDGFQGQEKDIIILSCVRAGPGLQTVGFLSDTRRMNVALTRAKSSLYILGNAATLERSDVNWRAIISDAKSRSRLVDVDHSYFTKPVTAPESTPNSTKPLKQTADTASVPPVPPDLFQPQKKQPLQATKPGASDTPHDKSAKHLPQRSQTIGAKRPAEEPLPPSSSKQDSDKRPPPPPTKRPKKAPNIFIPKQRKP